MANRFPVRRAITKGRLMAHNPIRHRYLRLTRRNQAGPRVFANSIPKTGTHLLMRCLAHMPNMINFHAESVFVFGSPGMAQRRNHLVNMPNGCFALGHVGYDEAFVQFFEQHGYRTLLMVRDPRDTAVSLSHFIMNRPRHPKHALYASLPNDTARLHATITGIAEHASIAQRFRRYLGWVEHGGLLVRFEDLVGAQGGGTQARQLNTLTAIAQHCGIELSAEKAATVANNVFSTKSRTFRSGKTGGWRSAFAPEATELYKQTDHGLLERLGYAVSADW